MSQDSKAITVTREKPGPYDLVNLASLSEYVYKRYDEERQSLFKNKPKNVSTRYYTGESRSGLLRVYCIEQETEASSSKNSHFCHILIPEFTVPSSAATQRAQTGTDSTVTMKKVRPFALCRGGGKKPACTIDLTAAQWGKISADFLASQQSQGLPRSISASDASEAQLFVMNSELNQATNQYSGNPTGAWRLQDLGWDGEPPSTVCADKSAATLRREVRQERQAAGRANAPQADDPESRRRLGAVISGPRSTVGVQLPTLSEEEVATLLRDFHKA